MNPILELSQITLFHTNNYNLTLGHFMLFLCVLIGFVFAARGLFKLLLPNFFRLYEVSSINRIKIRKKVFLLLITSFLISSFKSLHIDATLYQSDYITLRWSNILFGIWVILIAQALDMLISRIQQATEKELKPTTSEINWTDNDKNMSNGTTVQWLVYTAVGLFLVNSFAVTIPLFSFKGYSVNFEAILTIVVVLLIARVFAWVLTQILLTRYYHRKGVDKGTRFAVNQLLSYLIYILAFFVSMNLIDVKMNLFLGGAAALLVGVGLGLQQTFNDFFSGIILLFERSIHIGDIVNLNGLIGTVRKIGFRTSFIETRDNITVIVPNSKLVSDNVINWSHSRHMARFDIKVHVSFDSDTEKVKYLLLKSAAENLSIEDHPAPFVRFVAFAEYALEFDLMFWSKDLLNIDDVKSDLRFQINELFKDNEIIIPYPQHRISIDEHAGMSAFR